jgi:hypothetical protein
LGSTACLSRSAIQQALGAAGVDFIPENGRDAGVMLKQKAIDSASDSMQSREFEQW